MRPARWFVAALSGAALASPGAHASEPPRCTSGEWAEEVREALAEARWLRPLRSGGPEIEATPRFLVVYDQELRLFAPPWSSSRAYGRAFELAEEAWRRSQGDGIRVLLVFTAFDPGRGDLFYVPVANDVMGLGAGSASTLFDDRPGSALDGLVFLGEPRQLIEAGDAYFREAFLHEIAHRWLAYAEIEHPRLPRDALRGRQSAHWSFLVHAGSSPVEGNDWEVVGPSLFRTRIERPVELRFSPLDLYLMGLLPAHEVPSFSVLRPLEVVSPSNLVVDAASPPARRSGVEVTLRAEAVEVGIDHVIAGSGPRWPSAAPERGPVEWPIGIVVLSRGRTLSPIHRSALAELERRLEGLLADYGRATGGRMRLAAQVEGAPVTPLYGACEEPASCNPAQADRCEGFLEGRGFCTRACETDAHCAEGVCCAGFGFCARLGACSELPAPNGEEPKAPVDPGQEPDASPEEAPSSCRGIEGAPGAGVWLLVLALRLGARRRGWRGSPEGARRRRRPGRGSPEAA